MIPEWSRAIHQSTALRIFIYPLICQLVPSSFFCTLSLPQFHGLFFLCKFNLGWVLIKVCSHHFWGHLDRSQTEFGGGGQACVPQCAQPVHELFFSSQTRREERKQMLFSGLLNCRFQKEISDTIDPDVDSNKLYMQRLAQGYELNQAQFGVCSLLHSVQWYTLFFSGQDERLHREEGEEKLNQVWGLSLVVYVQFYTPTFLKKKGNWRLYREKKIHVACRCDLVRISVVSWLNF